MISIDNTNSPKKITRCYKIAGKIQSNPKVIICFRFVTIALFYVQTVGQRKFRRLCYDKKAREQFLSGSKFLILKVSYTEQSCSSKVYAQSGFFFSLIQKNNNKDFLSTFFIIYMYIYLYIVMCRNRLFLQAREIAFPLTLLGVGFDVMQTTNKLFSFSRHRAAKLRRLPSLAAIFHLTPYI